jgi:hypothetical protein
VRPECDGEGWRTFRIDRILAVGDAGCHYTPRRAVQLSQAREFVSDYEPTGSLSVVNEYCQQLWNAVADGRLVADERDDLSAIAEKLSATQVRAVHAQVFRDALQECLVDGELSEGEVDYLAKVRRLLKRLGWAP